MPHSSLRLHQACISAISPVFREATNATSRGDTVSQSVLPARSALLGAGNYSRDVPWRRCAIQSWTFQTPFPHALSTRALPITGARMMIIDDARRTELAFTHIRRSHSSGAALKCSVIEKTLVTKAMISQRANKERAELTTVCMTAARPSALRHSPGV